MKNITQQKSWNCKYLIDVDTNEYLTQLSQQLVIAPNKRDKIDNSIRHIQKEIWGLFQNRLHECIVFGSYDRQTIILEDEEADVDILITFKTSEYRPETYLKHIKEFCEKNYPRSTVYPDHPTVAIEMDHIKFELVPAIYVSDVAVRIPAPRSNELRWIHTTPTRFKQQVEAKNKNNKDIILPLIRVFRYWNFLQGKPFSSYEIEKAIIERTFTCRTQLRDYYFVLEDSIKEITGTEEQKKSYADLREHNRVLRAMERERLTKYLEPELKDFLPLIK